MRRTPALAGAGLRSEIPRHADVELRETELHQAGDATAEHRRDSHLGPTGVTAGPREARRDREQRDGGDGETARRGADLVATELREKELLESYLPQAPDRATVERTVEAAVAELSATSVKDMGRVIQLAKERLSGVDGKELSEIVRAVLSR